MSTIPTIDFEHLNNPELRQDALAELKYALIHVGFFYLKNHPISKQLLKKLETEAYNFFDLPTEEKLKCEMTNSKHFLGYTRLANEVTAKATDWREQIDLGTELPAPRNEEIKSEDDLYKNLVGPNLWPSEKLIPNYKPVVEEYFRDMIKFNYEFLNYLTAALGLPPNVFNKYFNKDLTQQHHKMKLIFYPDLQDLIDQGKAVKPAAGDDKPSGQGVGPHRDGGFITFIHQATDQVSLQVLSYDNKWLDVPPVPNTFVVAVGQTLEFISEGVIKSTIHRALTPQPGQGTRLSIPFFVGMENNNYKTTLENIPQELIAERDERNETVNQEAIGFQFQPDLNHPVGYVNFANRVKSHPDVARRWYPEYSAKIFEQIGA